MWSDRIEALIERAPTAFGHLRTQKDTTFIFNDLKKLFLNPSLWEYIAEVFSPIVLHLVSEIVLDTVFEEDSDDLNVTILLSNLINSFPAIQPLILFLTQHRPIADSLHIAEAEYLQAVYRLLTSLGNTFEIKLSKLLALTESPMEERARFYLHSIIAVLQNQSESKFDLSELVSLELQTEIYLEEQAFANKKINFQNFGPMEYSTRYATTVDGVPFLRSLSASDDHTDHTVANSPFARSLALAMMTNKPVLIIGPAGSGKTTLINQLASMAGAEVVSLHLGSAVDAKSLLGGYICGDIPGEFRWLDGPLTAAVRENERWIVLEQIEEASNEVLSLITPLLSEQKLFVPGRSETIKMGYNTRIFATSFTQLESSLWTKIQVDFLEDSDEGETENKLKAAIAAAHPTITPLIDRIVDSWKACKHLTYHELFRLCRRYEAMGIKSEVSNEEYTELYQMAVDTFTSHLPDQDERMRYAIEIAAKWGRPESYAQAYLELQKPQLVMSPFRIGNVEIPFLGDPKPVGDFAETFTSLHNMESVARALANHEPVLLVGETGTGKTTLVQFIAASVGADFKVINMHHQSDTLDIIGGFKPVDLVTLLEPLRNRFFAAFKKTLSQSSNAKLINSINDAFTSKKWEYFLKQLKAVGKKVSEKAKEKDEGLHKEWEEIIGAASGFLNRKDFLARDFAFGFVEGPLTTAFRTGQWILLDEVNLAPAETLLALSPIMDGILSLPNGEVIHAHENFRLICCMNPATDVGKTNLPATLQHKFVSIFSDETKSENDIKLILEKRRVNQLYHQQIFDFYSTARAMSKTILTDGSGRRILYSLRALTRSLIYMNKAEPFFGAAKACYDALTLSFISPLSKDSAARLKDVLDKTVDPTKGSKDITKVVDDNFVEVEGFLIRRGPLPIKERPDFILTNTARKYLRSLAQAAFLDGCPTLLQGPTSSGKTSIVEYLADITGHEFVRINNHEHTDMSEYIGGYATTESGKFDFMEGELVRAVRGGKWVVLDELNLAPSDVLEALNRLLDQNNQLYIAETQEIVNPGPGFHLFATQNPPGVYGGRKQLSRAFRGRFVEIHVDEIEENELTQIIKGRCDIAPSYADIMVPIFQKLRADTNYQNIFAGKQSFLTVRDLLRWGNRGANDINDFAEQGFCILGDKLRTVEARQFMADTIINTIKERKKGNPEFIKEFPIPENYHLDFDIVWTSAMRRTYDRIFRCIQNKEPILLVGETGTGKTTAVQVIAQVLGRELRILNCHQHTETSDFIGAMRPARADSDKLFEWVDGSLVTAMREGQIYLMDEISLAQDSALERLNSVLEPGRLLAIAEKPVYEVIHAHENFVFIGTMNPGGDYGKRELSPSLRNRFTEIWVPSIESDSDLLDILKANSKCEETASHATMFLHFVRYYTALSKAFANISLRDILQWIRFVDAQVNAGARFADSYVHGAFMVFIDCVFNTFRQEVIEFLKQQLQENDLQPSEELGVFSHNVEISEAHMQVGPFGLEVGPYYSFEEARRIQSKFVFDAPTTSQNLLRVARALQMHLPVLIEGPPGVGKTSLVDNLGQALGHKIVRINLSEHTEMLDLVGSELPVEGEKSGKFEWRDGAFLTALQNGDWVILDELNLASQSVLEGLNACLDHRAALFVPELGKEFKCHPEFRIFGCQNPAAGGGGRKSLPRSFLNRFTRVYVEELTAEDFDIIIERLYGQIDPELRGKMIRFIAQLNNLHLNFEFNLRDVYRWCDMIIKANISPTKALQQLFVLRQRTESDRKRVLALAFKEFGEFSILPTPLLLSPNNIRVGDLILPREGPVTPSGLVIHPSMIRPLESILMCAKMQWPGLIVGGTATSKSSHVRLASHLAGKKLVEFSMNSSVDTTELLGGFEQMDNHRCYEQLKARVKDFLYADLEQLANFISYFETIQTIEDLVAFITNNEGVFPPDFATEANALIARSSDPGRFEWVDGLLLQALRNGWWIIIDNANVCPPAVLDRLNPLCEPGGYILLNERGIVNGEIEVVYPHEDFRLFMTVDPRNGEVSRAMRNRSIEIYLESYCDRLDTDLLLIEECRALAGDYGEEFYSMMKECKGTDRYYLSAWNMVSYKTFKEQSAVAQLGNDAAHFNVAHCKLVTEPPESSREKTMTRSNSYSNDYSASSDVLSVMSFRPVTNTTLMTILYDAAYLIQKGIHPAAIRFFAGSIRPYDFDYRIEVARQWPEVYNILQNIKNLRANHESGDMDEIGDLPIDRLLWPNEEESLSFTAQYLLATLELEATDMYGNISIELKNSLSSIIAGLYSELREFISSKSDSDEVEPIYLLPLRIIDRLNRTEGENSLPLLRFVRSLVRKGGIDIPQIDALTKILCPNNSQDAKKIRAALGEPFTFKTKRAYDVWQNVNRYWMDIRNISDRAFYQQSPQIIKLLSSLIRSQVTCDQVEGDLTALQNIELPKEVVISFMDEIEEFNTVREAHTTIQLSTPFPSEHLKQLSLHSLALYVLECIKNHNQNLDLPKTYGVPLNIVAIIDSFRGTGSYPDLMHGLFEAITQMNKKVLVGPGIESVETVLGTNPNLLQTAHNKELMEELYNLLKKIPAFTEHDTIQVLCASLNEEAKTLQIDPIDPENFHESFYRFVLEKWAKISPLSEVDDSFYHMVVYEIASSLGEEFKESKKVLAEIMNSRIGNKESAIVRSVDAESSILEDIGKKSLQKSKYRGGNNGFTELRKLINDTPVSEDTLKNADDANALDKSATAILVKFPLYRDITVPLVTTLRQISMAICMPRPESIPILQIPFSSNRFFHDLAAAAPNESLQFKPLYCALMGNEKVPLPDIHANEPKQETNFITLDEETKMQQAIDALFSKETKDELVVLALNFIDTMTKPGTLNSEKLLDMMYKQVKMMHSSPEISIEEDLAYLPLFLYRVARRKTKKNDNINIYQKSSATDLEELSKVVYQVVELATETWKRYQGHDQLRRIVKAADVILKQPSDLPLIEFLNLLEQLMTEIRAWAYRDRDFGPCLSPLVKLANKWLKMRLNSWKQLFESRRKTLINNIGMNFYKMLDLMRGEVFEEDILEKAKSILDLSPIGALDTNIALIDAFALYSLRIDKSALIFSKLSNLTAKYRSTVPAFESHIKKELEPLEKKMKEFMELNRWDVDSDKKHIINIDTVKRQLSKYCQQHIAIINPVFSYMEEQITSNIARIPSVPFGQDTELDKAADEMFDQEKKLSERIYSSRTYANGVLDISSEIAGQPLEEERALYGKAFEKHNTLFGEMQLLLKRIIALRTDHNEEVKQEDAQQFYILSLNLMRTIQQQRNDLFVLPTEYHENVLFVLRQIIAVLGAFCNLDKDSKKADIIKHMEMLGRLKQVPIKDLTADLQKFDELLDQNYVHLSIHIFIQNSISELSKFSGNTIPDSMEYNKELANTHLSYLRFAVALMKLMFIALTDGLGESEGEADDQPQEVEGTDGVGMGEGVGDEDVTNEIEDQDQLVGDNVNTNEDEQNEDDVDREGGFEIENDMPENAPNVEANEEEDRMDDEMGETENGENIDERDATNDGKEADKEGDVEEEKTKEEKQVREDEEQEDDKDESNQSDDDNGNPPSDDQGEMEMSEQEDEFESDAGQWNEEPEQIEMPEDQDHLLDGNSEGEEEIDEEAVDFKPPDIEDEKDEFLGQTAPDKANAEEEDANDTEDVAGEGKGETKGDGEDGEGEDENAEEELGEENDQEKERGKEDKEQEMEIVQKQILQGKTQEGEEGGERDDRGTEGVIMDAEEAEEIPERPEEEDKNEGKEGEAAAQQGDEGFVEGERPAEDEDADRNMVVVDYKRAEGELHEGVGADGQIDVIERNFENEDLEAWQQMKNTTHTDAADLCEQLRLVLEATVAAKMRGDFRTGKRLNMRKIIPFIASGFRKDKIWMRRVQPDQRNYQVMLAIDNSSSMQQGGAGELALQSVALITQALELLGIGDLCVTKFGQETSFVHELGQQWNDDAGAQMMKSFTFEEDQTELSDLLEQSIGYFEAHKKPGSMQLCFIVSDGMFSDKDRVAELAIQAQLRNLLIVFVIIDSQTKDRESILKLGQLSFVGGMHFEKYIDKFPFPYYVVVQDPSVLPERISSALRQWFDLANSA